MTTTTTKECPKCHGFGSDLHDEAPTCRECGGSGLAQLYTVRHGTNEPCHGYTALQVQMWLKLKLAVGASNLLIVKEGCEIDAAQADDCNSMAYRVHFPKG